MAISSGRFATQEVLRPLNLPGPWKHGHNRGQKAGGQSPIYVVWAGMVARCQQKNNKAFKWYGAKGIKVCKQWQNFINFLRDMGSGYARGLTLERKNKDGAYEPGNVIWADWKTQRNNRSDSRFLEFCGERKTVAQWAEIKRMKYNTLFYRIFRCKWSVEKALTTPVSKPNVAATRVP